jgi:RNA-binding protein 8A
VKGYALIEYESQDEASSAIKHLNGKEVFGQTVSVHWAFVKR